MERPRRGTARDAALVPRLATQRLSLYLRQLEALQRAGERMASSRGLAQALGFTDAQVRRDLGYFGQFGYPGVGYRVDELVARARRILGTDRTWPVVVMGAGNLGRALASYRGFARQGFRIVALFDADPARAGERVAGIRVLPPKDLKRVAAREGVRIAIIAVPAEAAQRVCDLLVRAGIQGILNFAPAPLVARRSIVVCGVDLAIQLEQISYQLSR